MPFYYYETATAICQDIIKIRNLNYRIKKKLFKNKQKQKERKKTEKYPFCMFGESEALLHLNFRKKKNYKFLNHFLLTVKI